MRVLGAVTAPDAPASLEIRIHCEQVVLSWPQDRIGRPAGTRHDSQESPPTTRQSPTTYQGLIFVPMMMRSAALASAVVDSDFRTRDNHTDNAFLVEGRSVLCNLASIPSCRAGRVRRRNRYTKKP